MSLLYLVTGPIAHSGCEQPHTMLRRSSHLFVTTVSGADAVGTSPLGRTLFNSRTKTYGEDAANSVPRDGARRASSRPDRASPIPARPGQNAGTAPERRSGLLRGWNLMSIGRGYNVDHIPASRTSTPRTIQYCWRAFFSKFNLISSKTHRFIIHWKHPLPDHPPCLSTT